MICTISKVDSDMPKMLNKSCAIIVHTHISKYWLLTCVRVHAMGIMKSNKVVKTYIVVLLMLPAIYIFAVQEVVISVQ